MTSGYILGCSEGHVIEVRPGDTLYPQCQELAVAGELCTYALPPGECERCKMADGQEREPRQSAEA